MRHLFSFSWKSFVVDQATTLIGLLGAFLVLIGALGSVVSTGGNRLQSFLIVFGVHAFFGIAGVLAYRFANFRPVARIYTGIYTLLVPLVGFTAYNLVIGNHLQLSAPILVAVAATYAAIVYVLLAVYQRFALFGYLGTMALIVADLAVANALHLGYWWWPMLLMPLALFALFSIVRTPNAGRERYFTGSLALLRGPVRVFMYMLVAICLVAIVCTSLYSFLLDVYAQSLPEVRYALLGMTVLLLLWTSLWLCLTKRVRVLLIPALLFLVCILTYCYAFNFSQDGYILALTAIALLYHCLSRFAWPWLAPFGNLSLHLDQIALLLITIVPVVASVLLPLQLLLSAYGVPFDIHSSLFVQADWNAAAELLTVAIGCIITISMATFRAKHSAVAARHTSWPWLLLLSGFLLNWEFSIIILLLHIAPVWCFVGMAAALGIITISVRRLFGTSWSHPLDVVVLSVVLLSLILGLNLGIDLLATLLLAYAVSTYTVLLLQRRQILLFLPLIFALCALPLLMSERPYTVLLIAIALPLVPVAIRHIMASSVLYTFSPSTLPHIVVWEWPCLAIGLLYGIVLSGYDISSSASTMQNWLHIPIPLAFELVALALAWYAAAALSRIKGELVPVVGFAIAALVLPSNSFWVLVGVTPFAAIVALCVSRLAGRLLASPLYLIALFSSVMSGIVASNQGQLSAATWVLLGFGLLSYAISLAENLPLYLWLLPAFSIWSLLDSALQNDFHRLFILTLVFTTLGIGASSLKFFPRVSGTKRGKLLLASASSFYITALAAALLSGYVATMHANNSLFYGLVPAAMPLLLYAVIAYAVILFENRLHWLFLVPVFAVWGTWQAAHVHIEEVVAIALLAGSTALLIGRIIQPLALPTDKAPLVHLTKSWPWYVTSLATMLITIVMPGTPKLALVPEFMSSSLLAFALLTLVILLVERIPELLLLSVGLATWAIWQWQPQLPLASLMIIYSLLCVIIFACQFVWQTWPPLTSWLSPTFLHRVLGIGGQALLILWLVANGGLSPTASGNLPFIGAGMLLVLALLVFWYGHVQNNIVVQRCCDYCASLLGSLVISWLLLAFHQTNIALLLLVPATCLIVLAPLLMRDEPLPYHYVIGQSIAILGTTLLLLPTLWLSFSNGDSNLLYTLLLLGEALLLSLLGIGLGIRVFVLSGAGLIVVGALHALFLPTLGVPAPLALTILGIALLAVATALSLVNRRLQIAWKQWN